MSTVSTEQSLLNRIEEAIQQLRPFLEADGGDIEVLGVEGQVVKVRFIGACSTCNMSQMTLKAGIEEAVKKAVPEIKAVKAVDSSN